MVLVLLIRGLPTFALPKNVGEAIAGGNLVEAEPGDGVCLLLKLNPENCCCMTEGMAPRVEKLADCLLGVYEANCELEELPRFEDSEGDCLRARVGPEAFVTAWGEVLPDPSWNARKPSRIELVLASGDATVLMLALVLGMFCVVRVEKVEIAECMLSGRLPGFGEDALATLSLPCWLASRDSRRFPLLFVVLVG